MLADTIDEILTSVRAITGMAAEEGETHLGEHGAPPRVVFVVLGAEPETGTQRVRTIGAKTLPDIATDAWQVEAHCWGVDLRQAELLRAAVVTAVRKVARGRRYIVQRTEAARLGHASRGHLLVVSIDLHVPMSQIALPQLQPLEYPLAPINAVDFDSTNATPGDGELIAGES